MSKDRLRISNERAKAEFGISQRHEVMDNGERRFRLTQSSGSGYIYTVAGQAGAWQRSHSHVFLTELYVVERGWMAFAKIEKVGSSPTVEICTEGNLIQVTPGVPHNVYLPKSTEVHTIKFGARNADDWVAEPHLDELVCGISEENLLRMHNAA